MQLTLHSRIHFVLRVLVTLTTLMLAAAAASVAASAQGMIPTSRLQALIGEARKTSATTDTRAASASATAGRRSAGLVVPVLGVSPERLRNTFDDARSGGRRHDAIDIHAPRGTPVVATTDGTIIKVHNGARGGLALYQLDEDGRTRYYYAHLDRYAEGVREGVRVERGQVIGYVGDTGNAQPGDYHLHFSIAVLSDRRRWWTGENLNPFHVLRRSYERITGSSSSTTRERER
jgi:murein DD-endopeptidase MepM/ murein hydrolase activator NlpD